MRPDSLSVEDKGERVESVASNSLAGDCELSNCDPVSARPARPSHNALVFPLPLLLLQSARTANKSAMHDALVLQQLMRPSAQ